MSDDPKPGPPPGESLVDRRIREAMERGDFDDLPGAGKPLEIITEPYEPAWWVKRWMRREGVSEALQESLQSASPEERRRLLAMWRRRPPG